MKGLALDLCQIRHARTDGADAVQEVQAVATGDLVVAVDLNGGEEGVDGGAKPGHGGHGGGEILGCHGGGDGGFGLIEGREKGAFFVSFRKLRIGAKGVFDAVLLFGLSQDGVGAFVTLQEVRAVFGFEEGGQRLPDFPH